MAKAQNITNGLHARFDVVVIPAGQAAPAAETLTISELAASGSTSIKLSALPKALGEGDKLKIGSQVLYVAAPVAVSNSVVTVQLRKPTTASIAANATFQHRFMHPLSADKAGFKFTGSTVELTGFGDGLFKEYIKNAVDASANVSGKFSNVDLAYKETILPLSVNSVNQLYFELSDETGAGYTYAGRAIVNDCSYDVTFRGVGEYTTSFMVNGQVTVLDGTGNAIVSY